MKKTILFSVFLLFMGLMLWNIYLTTKISTFSKDVDDLQLKLDVCKGDLNVLTYDLITVRDSVRILKKEEVVME